MREHGVLTKVSWEEQGNFGAEALSFFKERWSPDSSAMFAGARTTNESNYITQKFMRAVIGSNNIDGCNRT
ncbi:MAG: hypothetical protein LOD92_06865 [Bacillales bacterium]